MKVMYWSDYACPYCYIGETHLKKAIENLNLGDQVDVEMLAFELDPTASKEYTGATVDRFARKYGLSLKGAQERIDGISEMGRAAGLDFRYAETRYRSLLLITTASATIMSWAKSAASRRPIC